MVETLFATPHIEQSPNPPIARCMRKIEKGKEKREFDVHVSPK